MRTFFTRVAIHKALLLVLLAMPFSAHALVEGLLGADAGTDFMYLDVKGGGKTESSTVTSIYGKYEHFVPFLPNGTVRTTKLSSDYVSFTKTDTTVYYSILGNALSTLDLGVTYVDYGSGSANTSNFSGDRLQLYGNVAIGFIGTPLEVFAQANFDTGMNISDRRLGIAYNIDLPLASLAFKLGQYQLNSTCNNCTDVGIDGLFLGASVDF